LQFFDICVSLNSSKNIYTKCFNDDNKQGGGILVKIDVFEEKISLLCKNGSHFQRYSFNDSLIYQKLSMEEKMIVLSYEYFENSK
jgi:hypothetical protein